jgi:hypothetical protein
MNALTLTGTGVDLQVPQGTTIGGFILGYKLARFECDGLNRSAGASGRICQVASTLCGTTWNNLQKLLLERSPIETPRVAGSIPAPGTTAYSLCPALHYTVRGELRQGKGLVEVVGAPGEETFGHF